MGIIWPIPATVACGGTPTGEAEGAETAGAAAASSDAACFLAESSSSGIVHFDSLVVALW